MDNFGQIKNEIERILSEKVVDSVLTFRKGTIPFREQPVFLTSSVDADSVVMNGFCQNNLAALLHGQPRDRHIGMVCRACESRAVRALVIEHQLIRENLYLIGVPCNGIVDPKKVLKAVQGEIISAQDDGVIITVETTQKKYELARQELVEETCRDCRKREPLGVDIMIGELPEIASETGDLQPTWREMFEKQTPDERYRLFTEETDRCIRCYACRGACPMCYCEECFVDHIMPRWNESMLTPGGTQAWHMIRAFHQTGRCVECGACERACPMDIRMVYLTEKLNDDMREKYGFEVGADAEKQPPFATITLDDKNRFVGQVKL